MTILYIDQIPKLIVIIAFSYHIFIQRGFQLLDQPSQLLIFLTINRPNLALHQSLPIPLLIPQPHIITQKRAPNRHPIPFRHITK